MDSRTLLKTMVYGADGRTAEDCALVANIRDRGNAVTAGVRFAEGSSLTHELLSRGGDVDGLRLGLRRPPEEGLMIWTGRFVSQDASRAWDTAEGQHIAVTQVAGYYEGAWRKPTSTELEAARWFDPDGKVQITWQKKTELTLEKL